MKKISVEKLKYEFEVKLVADFTGKQVACWTYFDGQEVIAVRQYFDKEKLTKETLTRKMKKELVDTMKDKIMEYTIKKLKVSNNY